MPQPHLHERLLQLIWEKQYVHPERLTTTDGRAVVVLHPGAVSLESGPDIREARLRIGGVLYSGDVEIHRDAGDWDTHGHSRDPRYNRVILHVVLNPSLKSHRARTSRGRVIPSLVLIEALDRPLDQLRTDLLFDERDLLAGRLYCTGQNGSVPADVLSDLLDRMALERMEVKLRRFEERIRELALRRSRAVRETSDRWHGAGEENADSPPLYTDLTVMDLSRTEVWEQVLYEGLMEGLGYSRNRRAFIRLSRAVSLETARELAHDDVQTEALLFGAAGLLPRPEETDDTESRTYVHVLRTEWGVQRRQYRGEILTPADWVRSPARPLNSPFVRLVAARSLLRRILDTGLFRQLLRVVKHSAVDTRLGLHQSLSVEPGPFWERRVSFDRVVPHAVQPLGSQRRDDLIVNSVAPLFLLYARMFRDRTVRNILLRMLRVYPASGMNAVTRRMRAHLFGDRVPLNSALRQQGAIQLFNFYCKEGRCRECDVGVRVWR